MSSPFHYPKTTIWIWSFGLYPRRVLYYFRAKGITTAILQRYNIHLIPVVYDASSKAGLVSMLGYEARPTETSLPCLRLEKRNGDTFFIHESFSIIEYLEEIFRTDDGYKNLNGETIEQRARVKDILGITTDAMSWNQIYLINHFASTTFWSGLQAHEMHEDTAAHAKTKHHNFLCKLEMWAQADVVSKGMKSLAGKGSDVTIADIVFMAQVEYINSTYGLDWLEGQEGLKAWYETTISEKWYIDNDSLGGFHGSEDWESILGK